MAQNIENADQLKPLEIISESFGLNEENLDKIFKCREISDNHVAVISVCGETRTGKSFLLSLLILYLKYHNTKHKFGSVYDQITSVFPWKSGTDSHTFGIWMWPKPFFIEGIDIPILLMDTQGMFGLGCHKVTSNKIFALSLLMSSIQIYNVQKNLQENDLEILYTFTEYGRQAKQHCKQNKRVFQHLMILLRDWQYIKEQNFGLAGGNLLIKKVLEIADSQSQEAQSVRNHISKCFDMIDGFLLPNPGEKVCNENINNISEVDETFKDYLEQFCINIFNISTIKPKEINGKIVIGKEIYEYFTNYYKTLCEENILSPISMIEATTKTSNLLAVSKTMENYRQRMSQNFNSLKGKQLLYEHVEAMKIAVDEFIDLPKFGDFDKSNRYLKDLFYQMWSFYDSIDRKEKENFDRVNILFENAEKLAFINYKKFMNEKFDSENTDASNIVNFSKFEEFDIKYHEDAVEYFDKNEEPGFEEVKLVFKNRLEKKIAEHYILLNGKMKKRNVKILADHEDVLESTKKCFVQEVDKIFNVDDIMNLLDERKLEKSYKFCIEESLKKYSQNIKLAVPEITDGFKNRFLEFTISEIERLKNRLLNEKITAERICKKIVEDMKQTYIEKMRDFENLSDIREKHPEILQVIKNTYPEKVEEVSALYKNFCLQYIPLLDHEIGIIHNSHISKGYIIDTFTKLYEDQVKIIVVGDKGVGKTSLVNRFINNHVLTVKKTLDNSGTMKDVSARITSVRNKRRYRIIRFWEELSVRIAIWDINTAEGTRRLPSSYYNNVDGIIIVTDVTQSDSLLALSEWIREFPPIKPERIFLVANKSDAENARQVSIGMIEQQAAQHSLKFKEVSAITGKNVDEIFKDFSSSLMTNKKFCSIM